MVLTIEPDIAHCIKTGVEAPPAVPLRKHKFPKNLLKETRISKNNRGDSAAIAHKCDVIR